MSARYTEFHPRWYRTRIPVFWWVGRRSYLVFVLRELTSVFVAWSVVFLLLLVAVVLAALRVGEKAGRLSDWQALILGITQGATELLPISSSGHLILVPWVANWRYLEEHADFNKTFDVALHLGTALAVLLY